MRWDLGNTAEQSVLMTWETGNVERRSILRAWGFGNIETQAILMTWDLGNIERRSILITWEYSRTDHFDGLGTWTYCCVLGVRAHTLCVWTARTAHGTRRLINLDLQAMPALSCHACFLLVRRRCAGLGFGTSRSPAPGRLWMWIALRALRTVLLPHSWCYARVGWLVSLGGGLCSCSIAA